MSNKPGRLLLLMLLVAAAAFASTQAATSVENLGASDYELFRDWRIISVGLVMVTIVLIAIGYAVGHAFDLSDVKGWAATELVQAFATAIIIVVLIGTVAFLDTMLETIVDNSGLGFHCADAPTQNCGITVSQKYIDGLIDVAVGQARNDLSESAKAAVSAGRRFGITYTELIEPVPLLQAAVSGSLQAGNIIHVERYNTVIEHLGNIGAALTAQRFFVTQISFKIAPILLALGIVGRSFFLTRRVGGLLMAIGIGVLYVFPLMYVLNWITLSVTLYGDSAITPPEGGACPASCLATPPQFYTYHPDFGLVKLQTIPAAYMALGVTGEVPPELELQAIMLKNGEIPAISYGGKTVFSCEYAATTEGVYCPKPCRELPYPPIATCRNESVAYACDSMPIECKVTRTALPQEIDPEQAVRCPEKCKVVPPLAGNCGKKCVQSPDYCRFAKQSGRGGFEWRSECWVAKLNCHVSMTAAESCVYVLPSQKDIDSGACSECVFVKKQYTMNPVTYPNCMELCSPSPTGAPKVSAAEFTRQTFSGMFGREEVKAVATLIVPAYVLPLLNVVVTLMFIRTLSPIFGGDIEIPGISKII